MVQGRPHIVSVIWAVRISAELLMLLLVLLSLTRMDERPVMFVVSRLLALVIVARLDVCRLPFVSPPSSDTSNLLTAKTADGRRNGTG